MSASMTKPWIDLTPAALAEIPVGTGVYEIRDAGGEVLDIGYAGAREPFGLRSAIQRVSAELAGQSGVGLQIRYEQHVQYRSRHIELVLSHRAHQDGRVPDRVAAREPAVHGRLAVGSQSRTGGQLRVAAE
ncbi:hypothetical protein ABT369_10610 [Dactylosporangium sp. NPDC000244]|uniref:DUF7508 domain-containing protein n=1 Tax=Dactylosporangium sp. NPDC000244 TaxID=3154365 RepID=UPI003325849E